MKQLINKNKFLILVLGVIAFLCLIGITKKKSVLTNNLEISSLSNTKNNSSSIKINADKTSSLNQDKISIRNEAIEKKGSERTEESQVPWQELNEKWNEELKSFLISINDREGLRMFNAYADARIGYLKEDARLGLKYQQIQASKPVDREKEDQFAVEANEVFKKAAKVYKKIFGLHYNAVKKFYKEFEKGIQVYSRDNFISLDFGFND